MAMTIEAGSDRHRVADFSPAYIRGVSAGDLLDALAASPADRDDGLRVYADQLIEAGDPFGELIVVALERLRHTTPELARREAALISQQDARLVAMFAGNRGFTYTWRAGFIDAIDVAAPLRVLPALAAEPVARMVRRIAITAVRADGDLTPIVAELVRLAPRFPRLVELAIRERASFGSFSVDEPIEIRDASPLYAAYPHLEQLELDGDPVGLGAIELASLRRFVARVRPANIRELVTARWPRLEELALWFSPAQVANVAATFGPLLHRDFGPGLTALELAPPAVAQRYVIDELPTCPLARHARRLALPGELERASLDSLIANAHLLRRLDRLELTERPLAASLQKRLRRVFGAALTLR
jgi:hypothetical protein